MVTLYLLLALTTSYSIYAADTEEPKTLPLPDDLVTIASSNEGSPKMDGYFFPETCVAYFSVLSLHNPGKDPQTNKCKLEKVQDLLTKYVGDSLQKKCPLCLSLDFGFEKEQTYHCMCRRDHDPTDVLSAASKSVNDILWKELSDATASKRNLIEDRAQYKVIGSLYLLSVSAMFKQYCVQQELVDQFQTKHQGINSGKLPCELGEQLTHINERYIITTYPQLSPAAKKELIADPLKNELDSNDTIAEAALGHLIADKTEENDPGAEVVIIDTSKLEPHRYKHASYPVI